MAKKKAPAPRRRAPPAPKRYDRMEIDAERDSALAVEEEAEAVSAAARGWPPGSRQGEDAGRILREAARDVARAEEALAEIVVELDDAATASDRLLREATETQERAIKQSAAAQEQALEWAREAITRAMDAAAHATRHPHHHHHGVKPLPGLRGDEE